jgi:hypothetical protein
MAETGIRPGQLQKKRADQVRPVNEEYSVLDYTNGADRFQNKESCGHYGFIRTKTYNEVLADAPDRTHPWSELDKVNQDITDYARARFGVHISAKYWRQRYKTAAESMGVPANIFNFLEGTTPKDGQNAVNYALRNKLRFLRVYDQMMSLHLEPTAELPMPGTTSGISASQEQIDRIESKLDQLILSLAPGGAPRLHGGQTARAVFPH